MYPVLYNVCDSKNPNFRHSNGQTSSILTVRADQSHLTQVFTCRAWNKVTTAALISRDVKFNVTCKFGPCS